MQGASSGTSSGNRMVWEWSQKPEKPARKMLSEVLRYMWWEGLRKSGWWSHVLPSEH